MKKKRDKKYNPMKGFKLQIQKACFVSFESESEDGNRVCVTNIASPALRDAVVECRTDWLVQIGVICDDGSQYYSRETYIIGRGKRINELTPEYEKERDELIAGTNPGHAIDYGWIIRPYSKRLERKVEAEEEKTVLDKWLERKDQFEKKVMHSLGG